MDRQQQGRHIVAAQSGKSLVRSSLAASAKRRSAARYEAASKIRYGVSELREQFDRNAYRLMYVVNLKKAVYVLHVFMKKSKSGIGIPKADAELIEVRLKRVRVLDAKD